MKIRQDETEWEGEQGKELINDLSYFWHQRLSQPFWFTIK